MLTLAERKDRPARPIRIIVYSSAHEWWRIVQSCYHHIVQESVVNHIVKLSKEATEILSTWHIYRTQKSDGLPSS